MVRHKRARQETEEEEQGQEQEQDVPPAKWSVTPVAMEYKFYTKSYEACWKFDNIYCTKLVFQY